MSYEVQRITGDTQLVKRLAELDERGREVVHMAQDGDVHGIRCWVVVSRDAGPPQVMVMGTQHPPEPEQSLEDLSRRARRRR
jgi:hypothetical protein